MEISTNKLLECWDEYSQCNGVTHTAEELEQLRLDYEFENHPYNQPDCPANFK